MRYLVERFGLLGLVWFRLVFFFWPHEAHTHSLSPFFSFRCEKRVGTENVNKAMSE
jgi:hypothetical protein